MDKLIAKLKEAAQKGDTTEFFNTFEEGMDNIRKNISDMPDKGPVVAAEWVANLNKLAGIPEAVAATHAKLKGPTEEAIKNTDALIKQSTDLTRSFNSMAVSVGKIGGAISAIALGFGPVVRGAQLLADALERIANAAERWSRSRTGNLTPEEQAEQKKLTDDIFKGAPQYPGRGVPPPVTPQSQSQSPNNGANANEASKAKLIEEENKRMADLAAEIKRLVDLTMVPTDKPQGNAFHNTPKGGAKGESNPMLLPANEKQPGGGAASEARQDPFTPPPGGATALEFAKQHLGIHEIANRPLLEKFFRDNHYPLQATAAWCAVYANSVLSQTGHATSASLDAKVSGAAAGSFLTNPDFKSATFEDVESGYGTYMGILKGKSPRTGQEGVHVGFLTGESRFNPKTGKLEYRMRGGNQPESDENTGERASGEGRVVSDIWYEADKLHLRKAPSSADELASIGIKPDVQVAQKFGENLTGDDLPGMGFSQRAKYRRMQGRYLPNSPLSTNIEDRRRIDLTGDPGGLEGTGSMDDEASEAQWQEDLKGFGLPARSRRGKSRLEDQLGIGSINPDRSVLDKTMGNEVSNHKVEGSADIEVNVKRSGKANDKVSSLFKMPRMERQSSGTPASHGPPEDISGGANSGIYT
jgi:hypothetical protein